MIRGYNFPSGSEEKVTIDGNKVIENLNLFTDQYTKDLVIKNIPININSISSDGRFSYVSESVIALPRLYYNSEVSITSTQITFSKPLKIVNTNDELITITLPTINIPSTSEYPTGSNAGNGACGAIIQNHLQDYYLICLRSYTKNKNSTTKKYCNGYVTIFKLNLDDNYNASWTQKCHEVRLFETDSVYSDPAFASINFFNKGIDSSIYIDDNEAIVFGYSGNTTIYGDTCLYHIKFDDNSCITIDTTSIFGTDFHGGTSDGFIAKIQNIIYFFQTGSNISKCIEIDANTNTIINSKNASEFYINNLNLIQSNFIYNNKLYFNDIQQSTYYLYEFIPSTWEIEKIIEISNIQSSNFLLNHIPLYLCTSEFYYHFNLENISFLGPYHLPEIPEIPKELEYLKEELDTNNIYYGMRYFFRPQYNYLLTYQKTIAYTNNGSEISLHKVYIRFLDNKPLVYTALQL